jgi:hypothetical protein
MYKDTFAVTPECIIVYPSIFEPESFKGGEEKYRGQLLIDKTADISALKAAIIAAIRMKFPGKDKEFLKTLRHPIRDGAEKAVDKDGKPDPTSFYYNRLFMTVKSDFQPQIVDKFNQPILDPKAIYGGCRVVVAVSFFGYSHLGNHGVSSSMRAIMKIADGDPIGGGRLDTGQVFAAYIDKTIPQDMLRNNPAFASKPDYYSDAADNIGF